jgi:hypothetical protein
LIYTYKQVMIYNIFYILLLLTYYTFNFFIDCLQ